MANINIRVDDNLKKEADELFASLGMNTTTAISVFLRKAVNYGGIPFTVRKEKLSNREIEMLAEDANLSCHSKRYSSVDEFMKALDA